MDKMLNILMVEDEPTDAEIIEQEMRRGGINFSLKRVETEKDLVKELKNPAIDLIISDYKLPTFSGISALKIAQQYCPDVPFIFVSGVIGEEFAIETLKIGATDYVLKNRLSRLVPVIYRALKEVEEKLERKKAEEKIKQSLELTQKAMKEIIHAVSLTVESRDPYTAGHQLRVSKLAIAIAKEMGFPDNLIESLNMASIIHDIGKITIPAEILTKPGKLGKYEFELIKYHSISGYNILEKIELPWPLGKIILQHHERTNGSGYPNGLFEKDILIEAKIIAVADVVEAMASHRPYRPALGIDKALDEIKTNKGLLYDEKVVDTCIKLFKEKAFRFD